MFSMTHGAHCAKSRVLRGARVICRVGTLAHLVLLRQPVRDEDAQGTETTADEEAAAVGLRLQRYPGIL